MYKVVSGWAYKIGELDLSMNVNYKFYFIPLFSSIFINSDSSYIPILTNIFSIIEAIHRVSTIYPTFRTSNNLIINFTYITSQSSNKEIVIPQGYIKKIRVINYRGKVNEQRGYDLILSDKEEIWYKKYWTNSFQSVCCFTGSKKDCIMCSMYRLRYDNIKDNFIFICEGDELCEYVSFIEIEKVLMNSTIISNNIEQLEVDITNKDMIIKKLPQNKQQINMNIS